jgi:dolichol kinase
MTGDPDVPSPNRQISMQSEVARKALHLTSIWIPIFFYMYPRSTVLWILIPLTAFSIFVDYGRYFSPTINQLVQRLFGHILRTHEMDATRKLLSGATYVFISALLCILIFPRIIATAAFAILIISDTASALIGRKYGKHRVYDKSIEGALAFALSGCLVVLFAPKIYGHWHEYVIGFIAACVGAVIEMLSTKLRLDDNLAVPTSIGLTLWAGYFLLSRLDPHLYGDVLERLLQ